MGLRLLVKIISWPEKKRKAEGIITEILGYEGDVGLDINCIMANHKIPFSFPKQVLDESLRIDTIIRNGPNV